MMNRAALPDLSLTEWAVLAVIAERPTHGFAIAKELAPNGDLGQVWTVRRPLVYRALATLETHKLIEPVGAEPGDRGPTRTRVRVTRAGRTAVDRWLGAPAAHVRDLRTRLLLQFRLLERRGFELGPLAEAQLDQLRPILVALQEQTGTATGFPLLLARWRLESAQAAVHVLEALTGEKKATATAR